MQASKCNLPNEVMSVCSNGLHSSGREVGTQATQSGTAGNQVAPRNPQVTWKVSLGKTLTLNPRKLPDPSNSSENFKGHPEGMPWGRQCGLSVGTGGLLSLLMNSWELRKGKERKTHRKLRRHLNQSSVLLVWGLPWKKAIVQKCLKATKEYWIGTG